MRGLGVAVAIVGGILVYMGVKGLSFTQLSDTYLRGTGDAVTAALGTTPVTGSAPVTQHDTTHTYTQQAATTPTPVTPVPLTASSWKVTTLTPENAAAMWGGFGARD